MATTLDQYGNAVVNGYSTNLPPPSVTAQTLTSGVKPLSIPQVQPSQVDPSIASGVTSSIISDFTNLQNQQKAGEQGQTESAQKQIDIMGLLSGKTADTQAAQETAGVGAESAKQLEYYQQLANLNAQASSLQREAQAIPIQVQQEALGQGVTDRGVAPIQAGRLRENALKALSLAQQADIASASLTGSTLRLAQAKEKAQQIVDLKYKPIEDALAREKELYTLNKDILDRVDKKRSEALTLAIKKDEEANAEKKEREKEVAKLIIDASPVAPPEVLQRAKDIQAKGGSPTEVAMALGEYGKDYLSNQLLKEQIGKVRAERLLIDTKASNLNPQVNGAVTAPNGDAISLPTPTLNAIGKLKLNEGQANAVAFTTRMIQANNNIKKQLGDIKTEGGFYETSGYDPTSVGSSFGRVVGSDKSRVYETNSKDFIRAKLRKESGATITDEEMESDKGIYTPSGMGLDEKDLLLAQEKRDEAIKAMIAQAGPASPYLLQYFQQTQQSQGETYMSENPQMNAWYENTSQAVGNATTAATNGGGTYGFQDNQKK